MRKWTTTSLSVVSVALLLASTAWAQPPTRSDSLRQQELAREAVHRIPDVFSAMGVRPGAVVADVGAGGGFLTVRLAKAVGLEGRVLAVDIEMRVLERLRARVQQEGLTNVEVVQGAEDDPHLPTSSLDAAVIVNAYHEMVAHQAMLELIRRSLKPEGRLVIIEPLSEGRRQESREAQVRDHQIALPFMEDEVRRAGFRVSRAEDPFVVQGSLVWSLVVAVPELRVAGGTPSSTKAESTAAATAKPDSRDDSRALVSPDLRMAFERFKQLRDRNEVIVVDVRTEVEYRSAHIPGAISIPLDQISEQLERLQSLAKPVATYCT